MVRMARRRRVFGRTTPYGVGNCLRTSVLLALFVLVGLAFYMFTSTLHGDVYSTARYMWLYSKNSLSADHTQAQDNVGLDEFDSSALKDGSPGKVLIDSPEEPSVDRFQIFKKTMDSMGQYAEQTRQFLKQTFETLNKDTNEIHGSAEHATRGMAALHQGQAGVKVSESSEPKGDVIKNGDAQLAESIQHANNPPGDDNERSSSPKPRVKTRIDVEKLHEEKPLVTERPARQVAEDAPHCQSTLEDLQRIVDYYKRVHDELGERGTHLHRKEAMPGGYFLNKTRVRHTLRHKKSCEVYSHEIYSDRLVINDIFRNVRTQREYADSDDVTMMTHLSLNRLDNLFMTLRHWEGPISAAIYVSDDEVVSLVKTLCQQAYSRINLNFVIHFVVQFGEEFFPINLLRNVALRAVQSDFVFLSDADFVPMPGGYYVIKAHMHHLTPSVRDHIAMVVPAYDNLGSASQYPTSKRTLLKQEEAGMIEPFHVKSVQEAHGPTNYTRWRSSTRPYRVGYGPYYEPYVVTWRHSLPPYVEEFLGRQLNKVTHIRKLVANSFQFWVLPDVYTIHMSHPVDREVKDYWECVNAVANMVMVKIQSDEAKANRTTAPNTGSASIENGAAPIKPAS